MLFVGTVVRLRDHQDLGLVRPHLPVAVAVTIAVAVSTWSIAARTVFGFGQRCSEDVGARRFEPIQGFDRRSTNDRRAPAVGPSAVLGGYALLP